MRRILGLASVGAIVAACGDHQASSPGANVALDSEYAYWTATTQVLRKHR